MTRRIFAAAIALALSWAPLAEAATYTNSFSATTTDWMDLGAGPSTIQNLSPTGGSVKIIAADSKPSTSVPTPAGIILNPQAPPVTISQTSHIWAMALQATSTVVVTTVVGESVTGAVTASQGTSPWVDNVTQWASQTLGAMANYGTSPGAVLVPGVNAFVTNILTGVQTPANATAVVNPDEAAVSGSVSSAATLFTQDMQGYQSVSVAVTANASGNTITFETSDDNTNWTTTTGLSSTSIGSSAGLSSTTTSTVGVMFVFPKRGRYFRARVSNFISGTTSVVGNLHNTPQPMVIMPPSLAASTNAIGKVGLGYTSAQTPITASATGTTAATTATLAGVSSKTTYICGFSIRANATAAATGNATVTGTITGTLNFTQWTAPLASGLGVTEETMTPCTPASGTNTGIAIVSAAPGSGGVVSVSAWGYQE